MYRYFNRYINGLRNSRFFTSFSAVGGGVLATALCLFAFAIIMTNIDVSDGVISSFSSIAICAGSYFFSFIVAKKRRKDGILVGVVCGGISFTILFLLGLVFRTAGITPLFFSKLSMIMICSIIGGIIGVNSKIRM